MTTKRSNATSLKIFAFSSRPSNLFVLHSEKKKQKTKKKISRLFLSFFFYSISSSSIIPPSLILYFSPMSVCVCVSCQRAAPPKKTEKKVSLSLAATAAKSN
jgi:hypothetical protein